MLQILIAIVAVGLSLYLWERFPAFKWVVATVIGIVVLIIAIIVFNTHRKQAAIEKEQAEFQLRYEQEEKAKDLKKWNENDVDLKKLKADMEDKLKHYKYESNEARKEDEIAVKQLNIWIENMKNNSK